MNDEGAVAARYRLSYSAAIYSQSRSTRLSACCFVSSKNPMSNDAETRLRALLVDGLDGDESAYRGFLRDLTQHLRAFLRKRIPQHLDDVEDLTQEILLAVHNARHTYRLNEPLTA